jgi:ABC-type multidrug transport system fused ATPase/permease subunit
MALADLIGVAAIMPFLAVVADPAITRDNVWLAALRDLSGAETDRGFLVVLGLTVFGVILAGTAVKIAGYYALNRFFYMRQHTIATRLLASYLNRPYAWFLHRHSGDLSARVLGEVDKVVGEGLLPAMRLVAHLVSLTLLLGLLIVVDPVVALSAALVVGGTYGVIFLLARRLLGRLGQALMVANAARHRSVTEAFGGLKELKLLGLEEAYRQRFATHSRVIARAGYRSQIIGELPRYALETAAFGGMILLVLALLLRGDGDLAGVLPVIGVYAFAGLRILPAVQQIYHAMTRIRFVSPLVDRIHADLPADTPADPPADTPAAVPATVPAAIPAAPMVLKDRIELRDLRFAYEGAGRTAIEGVTLTIPARSTVGLVGGTGAGKTTVVDLILGLLEPQSGTIAVDGVPIGPANRRAWQRAVGYVPQQIFLVDDTVAANIAFGAPPEARDMAAVERAARLAELHGFITEDLPQGYETRVGDRGVRLSGGQRQRIGIARALYRDPEVLVLDEATSALDNATERAVMAAVANLGRAKTIIMIAHRLSTVQRCDTIFLLDRGRVAAEGTYDELAATNPIFRRMVP